MQIKDYKTVTILLSSYQNKKVILHLKKQRYKCPYYRNTITSQIETVDKNNNISKEIKDIILEKLSETKSYKQIAKEEKVSVNTVIRVLETVVIKRQSSKYTSVIYIDEFKENI